jgi:ABC-type glycerol-3-phosphate transport system substrate-binding protein
MALLAAFFICAWCYDTPYRPPRDPGTVTITYWEKWTGFEGEAMKATIDVFNKKKFKNAKGETIFCQCLTTTQVDRKSLLAIAGGQPPDLAGFWSFNTHLFADMGALMPLDDFIKRDNFDMNRLIRVYRETCEHRGKVWCLPTTPATIALHWNKDMFKAAGLDPEQPPRTIQELDEFAAKLTKRDETGKIVQLGFLPPEPGWWNWAWGCFFGGKLNDGLEKITADDPKNIEALRWVTSFAPPDKRQELLAFRQGFGSFDSPQNAFLAGKVAMVLQGVWMANFIRFHNPHMKYGCAAFPAAFDTKGQPVTIAEMDVITIPRGCRHPDEAWEVIKFINSQEGMEFLCGRAVNPVTGELNTGGQGKLSPFNETSPGWIERHPHPHLRVFIELAKSENAVYTPKIPLWEQYRTELSAAFDRVWLAEATPEEALKTVQERMQPKVDRAVRILRIRLGQDAE